MGGRTNACNWAACETPDVTPEITRAAQNLACLLIDVTEFQELIRLKRVVYLDEEAGKIRAMIENYYVEPAIMENYELAELEKQLAALPIMREYRKAELAVRTVFTGVDDAISKAAGAAFAEYARAGAGG